MPRSRIFRPEHRLHRKVGPLSDLEYRLWCSMILEADDAGRFVCDAPQLRAQTWAYRPTLKLSLVEAAIERINDLGLIQTYEIEGVRYAFFPSWTDYQKPRYPTPSRIPAPSLMPQSVTVNHRSGTATAQQPQHCGEGVVGVVVGEGRNRGGVVVGEGRGRGGEPLSTTPSSSFSSSETAKILEAQTNGTITTEEARARLAALGKVKP